MNRRTRTLIVIGASVALAALASFGVYRYIQSLPVKEVPIAERFTVVATQTVPVGVLLTKDMVRLAPWPLDAPVAGGFGAVEDVVGRGVTAGLVANEPVIESKLAPREAGGGLPPTITPGMRAMSVRINDVIGVSGFARQGMRVDVIATIRPGQESVARTVISNVQVLAAGPNIDTEKSRDGTPVTATVVTLLLTPADAERLALAVNQGQIVLALRNPLDMEKTETVGVRLSGLLGTPAPPPVRTVVRGQQRMVTPPPPPKAPETAVRGIRGTVSTTVVIKKPIGGGGGGE
jgi:pilus assembly protein CpaB